MDPDLSALELPAVVEHLQTALRTLEIRVLSHAGLSPIDRATAIQHTMAIAAGLGNLLRALCHALSSAHDPGGAHGRN